MHQVHQVKGFCLQGAKKCQGKRQARKASVIDNLGRCLYGLMRPYGAYLMTFDLLEHLANSEANGCPISHVLMQVNERVAVHFAHPAQLLVIG